MQLPEQYVLLQTCDRIELYTGDDDAPEEIVKHLFRVTSGLDSPLLGETAIQGQVKQAYEKACTEGHVSKGLHRLFQEALRVGKRVRTETGISQGAMSHGQAAIEILKQEGVKLSSANILVIGANHLNKTVLQYLIREGNTTMFLSNRSYDKAGALSRELGCTAVHLDELYDRLPHPDTATSAPRPIIHYSAGSPLHRFTTSPIVIIDLAVPRDVEAKIGNLPNVTLYNIEDVERKIQGNLNKRLKVVALAKKIITEEYTKYRYS